MSGIDVDGFFAEAARAMEGLNARMDTLATQEFVGVSGDGLVAATVTGARELIGIDIHPRATRLVNNITLGELVAAAVNDAEGQAEAARVAAMSSTSLIGIDPAAFISDPVATLRRQGLYPHGGP